MHPKLRKCNYLFLFIVPATAQVPAIPSAARTSSPEEGDFFVVVGIGVNGASVVVFVVGCRV